MSPRGVDPRGAGERELSHRKAESPINGGSLRFMPRPVSPPPHASVLSRFRLPGREWRVVTEPHSDRNPGDEGKCLFGCRECEGNGMPKFVCAAGREPLDVDFCSITIDGSLDNDILQQRLHTIAHQREELQQMEIELRAQVIARSEVMEMQNSFDAQIKDHANAAVKLQEQVHEREQTIHELERRMEDKDRELHEIKLDNEAAWAKEDLLREQNKELATFRRERDNSEAERAQHLKQIHDLQEHIQEKERQLIELQDQFAEMERLHLHAIQQLQHELADARERSGTYTDEPRWELWVLSNGNADTVPPFVSTGNASSQAEHVPGVVPIAPSSLLGMPTYLPPGQVTAMHPFVMHQQGVPHSVPSHVPQSHVGHFHSMPAISSVPHWQNQQAVSEGAQISMHNPYAPAQTDQNILKADANYEYELSVNGQALQPDYLDVQINQGVERDSVIPSPTEEKKVLESIDKSYLVSPQPQQSLQQISSQFHEALRLNPLEQNSEKDNNTITLTNHALESQGLTAEQPSPAASTTPSDTSNHPVNFGEISISNVTSTVLPEAYVSARQPNTLATGKTTEVTLLDERSLLACIVRTIPSGSGGKIRSVQRLLPNRLGKMLAPLHWHDYKKKYGKLDDFVASHPELFVIEGDYIHLREGAQEMIAATAAVAKVAAAAAVSSPYSSLLPSVAVTPMAQSHRQKKVPSIDSKHVKTEKTVFKEYAVTPASAADNSSQLLAMQNQQSNGVYFNASGGFSNIKILSKSKDAVEMNGPEIRPGQSSVFMTAGNGANPDRSGVASTQNKGSINGRSGAHFVGKQSGRTTGAASTPRR
ncbi:hypothetical protein CK203_029337 [Vitis vinifera]|uniref:DUF7725 domain-containing protein n=1 Tax=Vitis vinifera TaxID=29760 RepID=A0A438HX40_VITVI|nr:hypothetical protein CK203_029337 [Vitis vinifera]